MNDKNAFPLRLHNTLSGCKRDFETLRLLRAGTGNSCPCLACPVTKSPRCRHNVEWRREKEWAGLFAGPLVIRVRACQTIEFQLDFDHLPELEEDLSSRRGPFDRQGAVLSCCFSRAAVRRRRAADL